VDTESPAAARPRPPAFEPVRPDPSFDESSAFGEQRRYSEPPRYSEQPQYSEPPRYSEHTDTPAYSEQVSYPEQPAFGSPGEGTPEESGAEWPETRTGPELEAEPLMGLGARLAALQAQSGGFSVITPDEDVEEMPSGTTRGIWDPKVPPVPAEPDEDENVTSYSESGSPGGSGTPSPQTAWDAITSPRDAEPEAELEAQPEPAPPPLPAAEPEPMNWDYPAYPAANSTEEELLEATRSNTSNQALSTLLLAKVLIPGYSADPTHWPAEEIGGGRYLVAFTSMQRLTAHYEATLPEPVPVRFTTVIAKWPTEEIGFALNPGTPMGRLLGGSEVRGLARSAAEFGLIDADALVAVADAEEASAQTPAIPEPKPAPAGSDQPQLMQRTVAASQVSMYLDRGYDRVCGFVHRAGELSHLSRPAELYRALGLAYTDSPFNLDDTEVYVLRWPAHLLSLYRIPFGGQTEEALQAMQGWMIERAPFRGNGFAPSESGDVVAEFKIDSTRLPHGAQLWRLNSDGVETLVALFDADSTRWRRIGSGES
jgi:hypothetical protein